MVVPRHIDELRAVLQQAQGVATPVSIAGGRHAMGGQQFGEGTVLIDTRGLDRVLAFDPAAGLVTVEGGIQWPALLEHLDRIQAGAPRPWSIYQKQTGADRLSLGGALSCNAHGRGLALPPLVQQVEGFDLVDGHGQVLTCSRHEHADLFRLAIGGYGLFGVIARLTLRLRPRVKVRRVVTIGEAAQVIDTFDALIRAGYLYGDFQFAIDADSDTFLRRGVLSCYEPVPADTPLTAHPAGFSADDWTRLTWLAHRDKQAAFTLYARRYLETSGQIYWGDEQLAAYVDDYHAALDRTLGAAVKGTEMITELYVPRPRLAAFLEDARAVLRRRRASVIYGTVRLVERDDETFLAWAREPWACVIFNLHVDHTPEAIAAAADAFRELIDIALGHGGSFYLTYHRWARRDQVEQCYPQMREFLAEKRRYDPGEVFQSEWYRHYRRMFA